MRRGWGDGLGEGGYADGVAGVRVGVIRPVIPAKAGIQALGLSWVPAFAGMTRWCRDGLQDRLISMVAMLRRGGERGDHHL